MQRSEIVLKLKEILFNALEEEVEISESTNLVSDLSLNSIALLYIALDIESEFKIEMKNEEIAGISTLGEWVDYVEKRVAG